MRGVKEMSCREIEENRLRFGLLRSVFFFFLSLDKEEETEESGEDEIEENGEEENGRVCDLEEG